MKLLFCKACGDVLKLQSYPRACHCKAAQGYYARDGETAQVSAGAAVLGIDNNTLSAAARADAGSHRKIDTWLFGRKHAPHVKWAQEPPQMGDLVTQIEALKQRRAALQDELEDVEIQLQRIRDIVGSNGPRYEVRPGAGRVEVLPPGSYQPRANRGTSTRVQELILTALAKQQPQKVKHLVSATGYGRQSIQNSMMTLLAQKKVVRRMDAAGQRFGGGYWYALTEAGFEGHPDTDPTNVAQHGGGANGDGPLV